MKMKSFAVSRPSDKARLVCAALNYADDISRKLGAVVQIPGGDIDARSACLRFIGFRDTLDRMLKESGAYRSAGFHNTLPFDYMDSMLPGTVIRPRGHATSEEIDPDFVIGCPWRHHWPPADPKETMNKLNAAEPGSLDRASYTQIGTLPLYLAGEGKNRVELFQRHGRKIRADVTQAPFPTGVEVCRDISGAHWLATWINEYKVKMAAPILFPDIAIPIYRLLGAPISTQRVPASLDYIEDSRKEQMNSLIARVAIQ